MSRPRGSLLYRAPVSEFSPAESTRDTFARLQRQLWVEVASHDRWPQPLGIPAYHDPSLVEDDDG